jgi:hypothetical protein
LPAPSRAVTWIAGVIVAPAASLVGCTVNASWVADDDVMSKATLVACVSPDAVARNVYPVPALSMLSPEKMATPATAPTVVVPDRTPPAGLLRIATVTLLTNPEDVLPNASWAATRTEGLMLPFAGVVVGGTVKPSRVGAPGLMLNALLCRVRAPAVARSR